MFQIMEGLCQRYKCPPSVIFEQDANFMMTMLGVLHEIGDSEDTDYSPMHDIPMDALGQETLFNG